MSEHNADVGPDLDIIALQKQVTELDIRIAAIAPPTDEEVKAYGKRHLDDWKRRNAQRPKPRPRCKMRFCDYKKQLITRLSKGLRMQKKKLETKIRNLQKKRFEKKGRCWVMTVNNYDKPGIEETFSRIITE